MSNSNNLEHGFKVRPLNIDSISKYALKARQFFNVPHGAFDLAPFVEKLEQYNITYDIVDRGELGRNVEACWMPETLTLRLDEDVYMSIYKNDPRARFTLVHEIGHFVLSHSRSLNREKSPSKIIKIYENSEWQANTFAAEFLMPHDQIKQYELDSPDKMASFFGVSQIASEIRWKKLLKRGW